MYDDYFNLSPGFPLPEYIYLRGLCTSRSHEPPLRLFDTEPLSSLFRPLSGYRVNEILGHGKFGYVYHATKENEETKESEVFAIKVLVLAFISPPGLVS